MGKLTVNSNLYTLYYYPAGLCWQVKHNNSGVTVSFETELLAVQSVVDADGVFYSEESIMYA